MSHDATKLLIRFKIQGAAPISSKVRIGTRTLGARESLLEMRSFNTKSRNEIFQRSNGDSTCRIYHKPGGHRFRDSESGLSKGNSQREVAKENVDRSSYESKNTRPSLINEISRTLY